MDNLILQLTKLRKKKKITQTQIAEEIGCVSAHISKIEALKYKNLNLGFLKKYAEILGYELVIKLRKF